MAAQPTYKIHRGTTCLVDRIPDCNFCEDGTPGPIDFKTRMGPWANGCEEHWGQYAAVPGVFGVGIAQRWITEDQVQR